MTMFKGRAHSCFVAMLLAGTPLMVGASPALAQTAFGDIDRTPSAEIGFSTGDRTQPIEAGSEVIVTGEGFDPDQQVTLLYGATPLPGGALIADAEGKIAGTITVPADAVSGNHPIVVVAQGPYHAIVEDLKVSPTIPLSGQDDYRITEAQPLRGLYQTAYSPKNNALFVTAAVGRPPVRQSELARLDPDTLEVVARVTPASAPAVAPRPGSDEPPRDPGLYAVYGVGVDDANDTVWITNTRQNTAAVYNQADLSLVKQFEPGTVNHARDVVIDEALGKAYVSATFAPEVVVFDTDSLEVMNRIAIPSLQRGEEFSAASLSFDPAKHRLYVVSLSTSEVAVIDTQTGTVEKVFPVPGARSAIGVSHDPVTGRIFVAAQGSDNLVVLDGESGEVIADTPVGAGALNVAFDPVTRHAYVSNRGAGTIAVTDVDGRLVANLGPAPLANHVSLGPDGVIYAVDKSANARGAENDTIMKIEPVG